MAVREFSEEEIAQPHTPGKGTLMKDDMKKLLDQAGQEVLRLPKTHVGRKKVVTEPPPVQATVCMGALLFRPSQGRSAKLGDYTCIGSKTVSMIKGEAHVSALGGSGDEDEMDIKYSLTLGMAAYTEEMEALGKPPIVIKGASIAVNDFDKTDGGSSAKGEGGQNRSKSSSSSSATGKKEVHKEKPVPGSLDEISAAFEDLFQQGRDPATAMDARWGSTMRVGRLVVQRVQRDNARFAEKASTQYRDYLKNFPGNMKDSSKKLFQSCRDRAGELQELAKEAYESMRK